jgi:hypothetical protein
MIVTFKSAATADLIMFGQAAQELLNVMGKGNSLAQGIFTVEQLPAAIDQLRAAIEQDRARQRAQGHVEEDEDAPRGMAAPVNLAQRGWPLLEMLERSLANGKPVTWGV